MSLPALAAVVVFPFMCVWYDFFFAHVLIQNANWYLSTQCVPRLADPLRVGVPVDRAKAAPDEPVVVRPDRPHVIAERIEVWLRTCVGPNPERRPQVVAEEPGFFF